MCGREEGGQLVENLEPGNFDTPLGVLSRPKDIWDGIHTQSYMKPSPFPGRSGEKAISPFKVSCQPSTPVLHYYLPEKIKKKLMDSEPVEVRRDSDIKPVGILVTVLGEAGEPLHRRVVLYGSRIISATDLPETGSPYVTMEKVYKRKDIEKRLKEMRNEQ